MVIVEPEPSALDSRLLTLYHTKDSRLGDLPIVVFHGPSTTTNSTLNTSRIQAHIFSVAGYQSFPRLTISPTSNLYSAVHQLPVDDQGDEICRGLAISLLKYFNETPRPVQECLRATLGNVQAGENTSNLFDAAHAARLASQMERVENSAQIITHLLTALAAKSLSWTDIDLILPPSSIAITRRPEALADVEDKLVNVDDGNLVDYGKFTEVVELFGSPSFLPTSRLRRAPSKPSSSNRSRTISDDQISALKQDLFEVLDTERNYVSKLHELANGVAPQWIRNVSSVSIDSDEAISQLFPSSLFQILDINKLFLERLEQLVENDASPTTKERDITGTNAFAKVLLEILPEFQQPYVDYIKASNKFFTILTDLSRDSSSPFAKQLQQTGEQRLRSWLIEPIQRLPRYVLFMENIIKKLPVDHMAVPKLLRAKDLIGNILDAQEADVDYKVKILRRLQALISNWPTSLDPGRLITAADAAELKPPYAYNPRTKDEPQSLILLFPNHVLIVKKISSNALSARGLMAEIDRPSAGNKQQPALSLSHTFKLHETRFTEFNDGHLICLASVKKPYAEQYLEAHIKIHSATTQIYALLGSYEGKAAKWNEEIARARIEHRFPEKLRENDCWGLRTINPEKSNLGIVSAVFEHDIDVQTGIQRECHGRIRVVVQAEEQNYAWQDDLDDIEIAARITVVNLSRYRLEFKGFNQNSSLDNIHAEDVLNVFLRQLCNIQRLHHRPTTTTMAQIYVSMNQKIAETIRPNLPAQPEFHASRYRPISPVKALSNFLGGMRDQTSQNKMPIVERSMSKQSLYSVKDLKPGLSLGLSNTFEPPKTMPIARTTDEVLEGAFVQLEKTFNTYIVALLSRCGNVVGKVIRNRVNADELMVNELYNVLLEDPTQYQATAEVPVDVLFAAFETFLNRAWKNKMGPVLPVTILTKLEEVINMKSSNQLGVAFKALLQEMTPQNQRAFTAVIKLLYSLLDASGNDGDRGAITAAVAEAIFQGVDYQKYISLLDRMVDNMDILFEDIAIPNDKPRSQGNTMERRVKATTPGSISSATSSFKKRFGFGTLSRENSKNESESRVGQILRNLSKKATGESTSQPSSLSKSFLTRSKSIDNENRRVFFSRPGSAATKDTPDSPMSRPTSSRQEIPDIVAPMANLGLTQSQRPKKKRRSSLSDITGLKDVPNPDFSSIIKPLPLDKPTNPFSSEADAEQVLPQTPSPPKSDRTAVLAQTEIMSKIPSPISSRKAASPSPTRKENIPPALTREWTSPKPRAVDHHTTMASPKKKDLNSTQMPSFKPGLSSPSIRNAQRSVLSPPAAGHARRKISGSPQRVVSPSRRVMSGSPQRKTSSNTQKLRMQSPQKLRERLDREKKAIEEADSSLRSELANIGGESLSSSQSTSDVRPRLEALETTLSMTLADLSKRAALIAADISTSLAVSEKKSKTLDELYREANAENELLYDRFNSEILRILDAVKSGAGLQETKTKLKESQDEASRLRKENQRLKRENLGLRSQLR